MRVMSKYYSANEFSQKIGVSVYTLKKWEKCGELYPHHVLNNRYRYYSEEQIKQATKLLSNQNGLAIGYLRTRDNERAQNAVGVLDAYLASRYSEHDIMIDEGFANYKLKKLVERIISNQVHDVIIVIGEHSPSDYNSLNMIANLYDCSLKIINYQEIRESKERSR